MRYKINNNHLIILLVIFTVAIFTTLYIHNHYLKPSWHTIEGTVNKIEDGKVFHTWTTMYGDIPTTTIYFDNGEILNFNGKPLKSPLIVGEKYEIVYKHYPPQNDNPDFPNGYNIVYSRRTIQIEED